MEGHTRPQVVIAGAGFGGLEAGAAALAKVEVDVTLIDAYNHHCFQPLLYGSQPQRSRPPISPGRSAPSYGSRRTSG